MTTRPLLGSLVAAVALVTTGLAGPAFAAPTRVLDGLGDSYASGYGVAPSFTTPCGRSDAAMAPAIDGRMRLALDDFVACAGARTTDLVPQGQIAALDADTDVVTLSIGGNDIGWSQSVVACLGGTDAQCAGALAITRGRVTGQLPALLDTVYDRIDAAAPGAHVYVTGYPRLFSPPTARRWPPHRTSRRPSTTAPTCSTRRSARQPRPTATPSSTSRSGSSTTASTPRSPGSSARRAPARSTRTRAATRRTPLR